MLRLAPIALALAFTVLPSEAPRADECDALAQQIAEATGARKVGRRVGPSVEIRAASGIAIDLTCRADPIVQAASSEPSPSATYFRDLTLAGQIVTGQPASAVQAAVSRAYDTARRERRKSFIQQSGWSASCYTDTAGPFRTLCSVGRIPRG